MHVGMADLTVFRFAKKSNHAWATAAGMYVGHHMAWMAAAFMLAAQIKRMEMRLLCPAQWQITSLVLQVYL